MQPRHLTFEEPKSLEESERPLTGNHENGSWLKDQQKSVYAEKFLYQQKNDFAPRRAVVKIRSLLSSIIEYAPPPNKFFQPRFKYYCSDSDPNYYVMHYRNVLP
ncbi:hypothetical protein TB2_025142 [Malus domestica]